jgi:Primase C terminal 2 (PriCT-2)
MRLQESNTDKGASADDWFHFDFVLGLGSNLLPCVPAGSDVRILEGSALKGKLGKIPSQLNHAGEAHGLKDWQKREIMGNEVVAWSKDRRLNLCVRTGPISGVYAIDVDIEDHETASAIYDTLRAMPGVWPTRSRGNSIKFLAPFILTGESCKKRIIKTAHGRIELLADGQQFVAAGTHSSGVRYQWLPTLPESLPTLTLEQLDAAWDSLSKSFGMSSTKTAPASASTAISPSMNSSETSSNLLCEISADDWTRLLDSLRFLLPHAADNDTWSEIGYALLSLTNKPAKQLFIDFSKKAPGYEPGAPEQWWDAHSRQTPRTDYRHIFTMAHARGMERVAAADQFPLVEAQPADTTGSELIDVVPNTPIRPTIQLSQPRYSGIISQLEDILIPEVFVQGPHLVRRSEAHDDGEIRRPDDALMLVMVTKEWLKKRLGEIADWQRFSKTDQIWVPTGPSDEHISGVINLRSWAKLRPLAAIARAPFLRSDGSICDEPGYDSRSRVLYIPGAEFPAIPAAADHRAAFEALERIRGVFDQFPWKERASESAFLSHILSEASRLAIDRCPMFFYDAPDAGTGKSLLQEMAARIVHGTDVAVRTWVGDGDEIRKCLYAALLAGDRSMWFDDIPDGIKIRSHELCAFLTSSTWTDRKLGESSSLGIPNKMVLVGSGNNITPAGALARRSLVIRMDGNSENLKERIFKIQDLRGYVMEHRPQLLVDALTIIQAYRNADDAPKMPVPLQSFEAWSRFCREPLIWLGLPDPVITQNETDDGRQSVGSIFEQLYATFEDRPFTSLDIARVALGITDANGELAANMQQNGCPEPNSPLKVGYWLRGYRDRISKGLKLVHAGNSKSGVRWKFQRVGEELIG